MPKIRGVKPEFWTDEDIVELSLPARLLFIGMWNFACDNGHLDDKPKQIKMRILPSDDCDVNSLLEELLANGRIKRADGTITIPKFAAHQRPHKRWWSTCDLPLCTPPDEGSQQDSNSGPTVAQPLVHRRPTVTDVTDGDGDGDGDAREAPTRKRATKIPDDWAPTDSHREYATTNGIDLDHEVEQFRNYCRANDKKYKDWNAGFRIWLGNAKKWSAGNNVQPIRQSQDSSQSWMKRRPGDTGAWA